MSLNLYFAEKENYTTDCKRRRDDEKQTHFHGASMKRMGMNVEITRNTVRNQKKTMIDVLMLPSNSYFLAQSTIK